MNGSNGQGWEDRIVVVAVRGARELAQWSHLKVVTVQCHDYDKYQAGTKRDISVLLLTPR